MAPRARNLPAARPLDRDAAPREVVAEGIAVQAGGLRILHDVDIVLRREEILGLIGPNGAGKTTLVNVLTGFQAPGAGTVRLGDADITRWDPARRARAGLARTFQDVRVFPSLSVEENLEAAAVATGLRSAPGRALAAEVLEALSLSELAHVPTGSLPHGQLRWVGIARALAMRPSFLLLDEPAAGLDDDESDDMLERLGRLRSERSVGLLVIEHDMRLIMRLCDRLHVLDHGQTLAVGSPTEVRGDPAVIEAYLGRPEEAGDAAR